VLPGQQNSVCREMALCVLRMQILPYEMWDTPVDIESIRRVTDRSNSCLEGLSWVDPRADAPGPLLRQCDGSSV